MEEEEEATNQTKKKIQKETTRAFPRLNEFKFKRKAKATKNNKKKIKLKRGGHGSDFCF